MGLFGVDRRKCEGRAKRGKGGEDAGAGGRTKRAQQQLMGSSRSLLSGPAVLIRLFGYRAGFPSGLVIH